MRIQRQNRHGSWDTLSEGYLQRISSDWGKYIFEFTNDRNQNKTQYRLTFDTVDLEKLKKDIPS